MNPETDREKALEAAIRAQARTCFHRSLQTFGKNIHRCDHCAYWWTTPLPQEAA